LCAALSWLCVLTVTLGHSAWSTAAPPTRVVVEIDERAAQEVEPNLVRRLVRLELADVTIPPPHDSPGPETPPPVYVRIEGGETALSVELWERGLLRGERRVSVRGSPQLTARSVALVTAELAERLVERRRVEARVAAVQERRARKRSMEERGYPLFARIATGAAIEAANLGWDRQWLVGPGVNAELRLASGARLGMLVRGFAGRGDGLTQQWVELGFAPGYSWRLSRRSALSVELFATAAAVSFPKATRVDDSLSSSTWNSRAGASTRWGYRLWPNIETHLALRAGSTVRKLDVSLDDGTAHRLGGLWLGLELGGTFDHVAPP
jgi:hypothetical protein